MTRLIKRYGNRKMYDTVASRYVTLDGVTDLVRAGEDLEIIDNDSGEDLTTLTFAQIILEEEKRKRGLLDLPVLRWIIQQGGATFQEILHQVDRGREAFESMRELAEKRVQHVRDLVRGDPSDTDDRQPDSRPDEPATSMRVINEWLEIPQRQIEQLQHRIDTQVRASVDAISKNPTLRKELQRLEKGIHRIERRLGGAPQRTKKGATRERRKRRSD